MEAPTRPVLFVARLLVDPDARRRGVGRTLLEQARRAAVESGHCSMLDVVANTEGGGCNLALPGGWLGGGQTGAIRPIWYVG